LRELPSQERLEQARSAVGYQAIELEGRRVRLTRPGMRLDLGGIAKGYALDAALKTLNDHGITQALVRGGGEFVAGQPPPSQPGWPIALAGLDPQEAPSKRLLVSEAAVATSGDAWQFVELAGRRYSHIVDPASGLGLTRRTSVTVVAPRGADADALATAFCVLGSQRSQVLVNRLLDGKLPFLWMRAIQVSDEGEVMEVTAGTLPPTVTP
jgi:thiamine biosynthesis lipoprotein